MDHELHRLGLKLKFAYSLAGLVLGLACILAGVVLGLAGVAGKTTWAASFLGLSTNLTDATPGVIIFVVGIFMVLITRFKVKEEVVHDNHPTAPPPPVASSTTADPSAPVAPAAPAVPSGGGVGGNVVGGRVRHSIAYQVDKRLD
jgi:hypothetical protein